MSNFTTNKSECNAFRRELAAYLDDISSIDIKVLNKTINAALAQAKLLSPVDTGYLRRSWFIDPAKKTAFNNVEGNLFNIAEYAAFVNYGHRVKNRDGETVGFVEGKFFLEKSVDMAESIMVELFKKELKRVKSKHERNS